MGCLLFRAKWIEILYFSGIWEIGRILSISLFRVFCLIRKLALMKKHISLLISSALYIAYGAIFIGYSFTEYASSMTHVAFAVFFALIYFCFGYFAWKLRDSTFQGKLYFGIITATFLGVVAGISNWQSGLFLGLPFIFYIIGIRDILWQPTNG